MTIENSSLTDALAAEGSMSVAAAERLAGLLLSNEVVAPAALEWSRTGTLPDLPVVAGHTPAELGRTFTAGQSLSILSQLDQDPSQESFLLAMPGKHSAAVDGRGGPRTRV